MSISNKHGIYDLPQELPNGLRLRTLGNWEISGKVLYQTSNAFNTKFESQWKDGKSIHQVKLVLSPFWKLVTLTLG